MDNTLSERVKACMAAIGYNNEQLAKACDVSAPTAYHWASGKTKAIKAEPLMRAAKLFGVTPEWLASGKPPKYPPAVLSQNLVQESSQVLTMPVSRPDPMAVELLDLFGKLDKAGKAECLGYVRGFVMGRRPHAHGQASAVAG